MTMAVTDPTALQASDYVVQADADNPGTYLVTRQRDGVVRSGVASGDVVDGFRIDDGAVPPSAGERFLFKPAAGAAGNLTLALRNPQGLAAANPVTANAAASNVGTLAVAKVDITAAPASGYTALTLRFTDDAGAYTIEDGAGIALASGSYTAGQAIAYDGMAVSLSGLPKLGDKVNIAPTVHVSSSNGNALTMQGMGALKLVGGQTAADAFSATLSDMGVRTQSAQASASNTGIALQRAKSQLTGETGVNLDEEAARLIQYQQSYQAAAKVLQTAQTMLDTVIQLAAH
ncbi:MAG: hypothetical protein CFE45_11235 [Burkholderiales bacterium PBB5]|nr:MAG: hypothetical protein CFE45_11235 [Burkholderiales bacterium PBB5]